jgi:7-cyano-7-deazaguanine synthase
MRSDALVIFSGGLDSTTALYWAKERFDKVYALNFAYGSNHQQQECMAARKIADALGVKMFHIPLSFIGEHFKSALLGGIIPDGEYQKENMGATVVPFRNGIMLSVAAGLANSLDLDSIVLGNHSGDHFVYPDCRPDFIEAMKKAVDTGTDGAVRLLSPFCNMNKADIVQEGIRLGVDFASTYSCYKGGGIHCGVCATCLERKEAFITAGISDPTEYNE